MTIALPIVWCAPQVVGEARRKLDGAAAARTAADMVDPPHPGVLVELRVMRREPETAKAALVDLYAEPLPLAAALAEVARLSCRA